MRPRTSSDPTITCPQCHAAIPLTETLAGPLVAEMRRGVEEEARRRLDEERRAMEERITRERAAIEARAAKDAEALEARLRAKAEESVGVELRGLREDLAAQRRKVEVAQGQELALRRRTSELEEERRTLELRKARELDEERARIREAATKEATERFRLGEAEKDKVIGDLRRTIDELQRKAELRPSQLQGEVQELALETLLAAQFPRDVVAPVKKGQLGADCVQRVIGPEGAPAGTIVWESKRTKAWSDGWLAKLRDDRAAASADEAVIVTAALPRSVSRFGFIDGVWVTDFASAAAVAAMLRHQLVERARLRCAIAGQETRQALAYEYVCGARLQGHFHGLAATIGAMREELDGEKRAAHVRWAKREKAIERLIASTGTMYGDLQGIAGQALPELEALEPRALLEPPA
jgi:hypothetical protein